MPGRSGGDGFRKARSDLLWWHRHREGCQRIQPWGMTYDGSLRTRPEKEGRRHRPAQTTSKGERPVGLLHGINEEAHASNATAIR